MSYAGQECYPRVQYVWKPWTPKRLFSQHKWLWVSMLYKYIYWFSQFSMLKLGASTNQRKQLKKRLKDWARLSNVLSRYYRVKHNHVITTGHQLPNKICLITKFWFLLIVSCITFFTKFLLPVLGKEFLYFEK